MLVLRKKYC